MFAPVSPLEYDPSTGTWRAMDRYSTSKNLLWTLLIALTVFGFASHALWIGAGILAVVLILVETVSRRRSRARGTGAAQG